MFGTSYVHVSTRITLYSQLVRLHVEFGDPQFETYGHTEESPAWGHEDDEGIGAPLM